MPRSKPNRNPLGSILKKQVTKNGARITVYDVRIRKKDPDGRYRDKTQRCYSAAAAQIALGNMWTAKENEEAAPAAAPDRTFHFLTEYYRSTYCKPAVIVNGQLISGFRQDPATIERYTIEFDEYFGDISLKDLTYEHVRSYAEYLSTTPRTHNGSTSVPKPSTVNRKLAYLRRVLNIAKRSRWIDTNPFNEGEPLIRSKSEAHRERVLTYEEEVRLLDACVDPDKSKYTRRADKVSYVNERSGKTVSYDRPEHEVTRRSDNRRQHLRLIVIMAIDTGMRHSEIFKLKRKDILLEQKVIDLPKEITKAFKRRIIVISERLEKELVEYFKKHPIFPSDLVMLGQKSCEKSFATACTKAGIEGLTFHDLRHTATTWLDEAGVTRAANQNMIGHTDDRTHQDYHNPSVDILNSIREKMDRHLREREESVRKVKVEDFHLRQA